MFPQSRNIHVQFQEKVGWEKKTKYIYIYIYKNQFIIIIKTGN